MSPDRANISLHSKQQDAAATAAHQSPSPQHSIHIPKSHSSLSSELPLTPPVTQTFGVILVVSKGERKSPE